MPPELEANSSRETRESAIAAARHFALFPAEIPVPDGYAAAWRALRPDRPLAGGRPWPVHLVELIRDCQSTPSGPRTPHCFSSGTGRGCAAEATRAILRSPRPRLTSRRRSFAHDPRTRALRESLSWRTLAEHLGRELEKLDRHNPSAHVVIACLNPHHGHEGDVDVAYNSTAVQPGGRLDRSVRASGHA